MPFPIGQTWWHLKYRCTRADTASHMAQLVLAPMQVKPGHAINQLFWTSGLSSPILVADLVGNHYSLTSSITAWDASDLQPLVPQKPSTAVDKVSRSHLGWCKPSRADIVNGISPSLHALVMAAEDDPHRFAHMTLNIVDPSTMLATPSPASHFCCFPDWISRDGSRAVLFDATIGRCAFWIYNLPGLQAQARLSFPAGHPIASSPSWNRQNLVEWAPTGDLVAILWDAMPAETGVHFGPLTVHDASNGHVVCSCHPWAGTSDMLRYDLLCSWAPSSSTFLVMQLPGCIMPEGGGCFWLCKMDGRCTRRYDPPGLCLVGAAFSPCARFVWCDYISRSNEDDSGESQAHHVAIFTADADSMLFNHQYTEMEGEVYEVIFGLNDSIAVLPQAQCLLIFRDDGRSILQTDMFVGLDAMRPQLHAFKISRSPCGKILVGMLDGRDPAAKAEMDNARARDIEGSLSSGQMADLLWQAWTVNNPSPFPERQQIPFRNVTGLHSAWLPQTITWHPSSGKHTLYAIANSEQHICLIDAQHRACLKMWQYKDLLEMSGGLSESMDHELDGAMSLTWSPDGAQLALACCNRLLVLMFG